MTNYEKYKKEIMKAVAYSDRVGVMDGKLIMCDDMMDCNECIFSGESGVCGDRMIDWLNAEYVEPEVDWSKVPFDAKVLCRDNEYDEWVKRYYAGTDEKGRPCAFRYGHTSWTTDDTPLPWKFMKLADGE